MQLELKKGPLYLKTRASRHKIQHCTGAGPAAARGEGGGSAPRRGASLLPRNE